MMTSQQGYDIGPCDVLNKAGQKVNAQQLQRYLCVKCKFILREACQLGCCGDRVCRGCIPPEPFDCPSCTQSIDASKPQAFFADKSCQNDIRHFTVVCLCQWTGTLVEWEVHCETCDDLNGEATADDEVTTKAFKQLRRETTEVKLSASRANQKAESNEREIKQMKLLLEEMQKKSMVTSVGVGELPSGSSGHLSELRTKVDQIEGAVSQMDKTVNELNQTVPRYEKILEEMNLKLEILEVKSTTGVYVWKINEISRRSREARTGKTVSLYSPPFYTSLHGYRMCLRAYLYGDGMGKGTHISLFLVLMKSEYDDLLSWPFKHQVTMSLINQTHPLSVDQAITHKFVPNPESSSFQKPTDTFNIASGFPKFAPLNKLEDAEFVRNDTIYIRVKLDSPVVPTGPDTIPA